MKTGSVTPPPTPANSGSHVLGWREWVALPALGIPAIKAKLDTGARTSALHAHRIERFDLDGADHVRFWLHPLRKNRYIDLCCEAPVLDRRVVRDSGGHAERRYVIASPIRIGDQQWTIEITLTDREDMMFRMLLGRSAMTGGNVSVNPAASYLSGRALRNAYSQDFTRSTR